MSDPYRSCVFERKEGLAVLAGVCAREGVDIPWACSFVFTQNTTLCNNDTTSPQCEYTNGRYYKRGISQGSWHTDCLSRADKTVQQTTHQTRHKPSRQPSRQKSNGFRQEKAKGLRQTKDQVRRRRRAHPRRSIPRRHGECHCLLLLCRQFADLFLTVEDRRSLRQMGSRRRPGQPGRRPPIASAEGLEEGPGLVEAHVPVRKRRGEEEGAEGIGAAVRPDNVVALCVGGSSGDMSRPLPGRSSGSPSRESSGSMAA